MQITGKGVSGGVAVAPVRVYKRTVLAADKKPVQDIAAELARFAAAAEKAAAQLDRLVGETQERLGAGGAELFEVHRMMLEDEDFREAVKGIIEKDCVCAEYAVSETAQQFAKTFLNMDSAYMQARAADVQDVSRRVLAILNGAPEDGAFTGEAAILASDDFAPSETARFDRAVVKGIITSGGAVNSHTAIFARTLGIPAVIGAAGLETVPDGAFAILDGDAGELFVHPDEALVAEYAQRQEGQAAERAARESYRGRPTVTKDGRAVKLFANIGSAADAALAMENDAEGVGLFRSEFLYLGQKDYPGEQQQFAAYKSAVETMAGRRVIIRTLDIGADKSVGYFGLPEEENPAMGLRAIRICLQRPELFKTQLRAIYRTSAFGNVAVMLPMVAFVAEVRQAKAIIEEVKAALAAENVAFAPDVKVGIMVETPAAAAVSDRLAKEVDFFSIGTNDLTQYTLAVDRMNPGVANLYDDHHEALLRLIRFTVQSAHENGIEVGICGELAADETLTRDFLDMGVDELSVAPGKILGLRKAICEM